MATRVFIIPRRNDLEGMNVQITDLWPNTSQRNSIYDGEGQTHYVGACADTPGATTVSITDGVTYVSGSRSTEIAINPVASDTLGDGSNDCWAPANTTFGLAAYIRERVQKATNGSFLTLANANNIAAAIRTTAEAGTALTSAAITALCAAEDAGSSLTADPSFGTVVDILRILSGEVYVSPRYCIITDIAGPTFLNLADRTTLVDAQLTGTTGRTYVAAGNFLTDQDAGYVGRPTLARTGYLLASLGAGQLLKGKTVAVPLWNSNFTYSATGTALDIAGNHILADGLHIVLTVYDNVGNAL